MMSMAQTAGGSDTGRETADMRPDMAGLALLESRLQEQARALAARIAGLKQELGERAPINPEVVVTPDEGASAAEGDEETIAQIAHDQAELAATQAALQRMQQGHYGVCEISGGAIAMSRLMALPQAATCVSCQSAIESHSARRPRPL